MLMITLLRTEVRSKYCGVDGEPAVCDFYMLRGCPVYDVGSVMFRQIKVLRYWNSWSNFGLGTLVLHKLGWNFEYLIVIHV